VTDTDIVILLLSTIPKLTE